MKALKFWKREVKDPKKIAKLMKRNLFLELGMIRFYENNIHLFKDGKSKAMVNKLIIESLGHATMFAKEISRLQPAEKQPCKVKKGVKKVLQNAMREEVGAREIYLFQSKSVKDKNAVKTLRKIAGDEKQHQMVVRMIAERCSENFTKKEKTKLMKKLRSI